MSTSPKGTRQDRLRIVHLGKYYPPHRGGMETHLRDLVVGQARSSEVRVVVAGPSIRKSVEALDGGIVTRVPTFGKVASMPVTPTLSWELRRFRPDVLHVHTPNPGAACAVTINNYHGPLVVTHHSDTLGRESLRKLADPFVRALMERADRIIVTSKGYLNSSSELKPYRSKCVVVPLGIDLSTWTHMKETDRDTLGSPFGSKFILAIGRLVPYKGFRFLIKAMQEVQATLAIIGTGPLDQELRSYAQECGVADKVKFLGHVADVHRYYSSCSVFVLPSISRAEAFGLVQLEAMAAAVPVVNTAVDSGVPEISVDGMTGFTVSPSDSSALGAAINLLLRDEALRERFGRAARKRVFSEFSAELMVSRTLQVYEQVLQSRGIEPLELPAGSRQ